MGYKVVTVSYDYIGKDQTDRRWTAYMQALDRCHISGYQDAQLAAPPLSQCQEHSQNRCLQFHVTVDYDCIGMGYQTSS